MTKGRYPIQEGVTNRTLARKEDTSHSSCMCVMFILFVLLLLILFFAKVTPLVLNGNSENYSDLQNSKGEVAHQNGKFDRIKETKRNEEPVTFSTPIGGKKISGYSGPTSDFAVTSRSSASMSFITEKPGKGDKKSKAKLKVSPDNSKTTNVFTNSPTMPPFSSSVTNNYSISTNTFLNVLTNTVNRNSPTKISIISSSEIGPKNVTETSYTPTVRELYKFNNTSSSNFEKNETESKIEHPTTDSLFLNTSLFFDDKLATRNISEVTETVSSTPTSSIITCCSENVLKNITEFTTQQFNALDSSSSFTEASTENVTEVPFSKIFPHGSTSPYEKTDNTDSSTSKVSSFGYNLIYSKNITESNSPSTLKPIQSYSTSSEFISNDADKKQNSKSTISRTGNSTILTDRSSPLPYNSSPDQTEDYSSTDGRIKDVEGIRSFFRSYDFSDEESDNSSTTKIIGSFSLGSTTTPSDEDPILSLDDSTSSSTEHPPSNFTTFVSSNPLSLNISDYTADIRENSPSEFTNENSVSTFSTSLNVTEINPKTTTLYYSEDHFTNSSILEGLDKISSSSIGVITEATTEVSHNPQHDNLTSVSLITTEESSTETVYTNLSEQVEDHTLECPTMEPKAEADIKENSPSEFTNENSVSTFSTSLNVTEINPKTTTPYYSEDHFTNSSTLEGLDKISSSSIGVITEATTEVSHNPQHDNLTSVSLITTEESSTETVYTNLSEQVEDHSLECPTMEPKAEGPELCETNLCKMESSTILSKMNHSFDYCQDFYEYACGGMRNSKIILEDNPNDFIFGIIEDEINIINDSRPIEEITLKRFYDSCLEYKNIPLHERIEIGRRFINSIGLMFTEEADVSVHTFTLLIKNLLQLGSFPFFNIGLDVDHEDNNELALTLSLDSQENYLFSIQNDKEKKCRKFAIRARSKPPISLDDTYQDYISCMNNYSNYLTTIGEALSRFRLFGNESESATYIENVKSQVEETIIASFKKRPVPGIINKLTSMKKYDQITVLNLHSKFDLIDWKYLLSSLLRMTVTDLTKIQVYLESYFDDIFSLLKNSKELWKVHNALLAHLCHNIYKYFVKTDDACNRDNYCVQITSRLVPDITSNIFMKRFDEKTLHEQESEVEKWRTSIRDTLLEELNEITESSLKWLDHASLEAVKEKINNLRISLPRPYNRSELNLQEFSLKDDYFSSSMGLIKRKNNLIFSTYRLTSNSHYVLWLLFSRSFSDDSSYIYQINTLVIPQVILLKHVKKLPDPVVIARLGYTIAKAFSQAFDITGIEIDHVLTSESYYTFESALKFFNEGAFDFIQSHTEDGKPYQFRVTTSQTLNHRFSDITATKLALETLKRQGNDSQVLLWGGFSKEQLYYVTLAQTFCSKKKVPDLFPTLYEQVSLPPFLRIRTMFSNIEEFTESFPCASGMPMRIEKDIMLPSFPYLSGSESDFDYSYLT